LLPNEELDGDTGAALAVWASIGIAISEIKARAAMNFLMTHLLLRNVVLFPSTTTRRIAMPCVSKNRVLKTVG
jgi:hypothetical protein